MTETIIPQLDRAKSFTKWFDALTSGEYTQGTGALCKFVDEDGKKRQHCCVGVLDEVVYETDWEPAFADGRGYTVMVDKFGEESNMSEASVAPLGLDKKLTPKEVALLGAYSTTLDTGDTRIAALAMINDDGADYDTIVMLITELGWQDD